MNGTIYTTATEKRDSDICDCSNGDFTATGDALIYRLDGVTHVRRIYKPSDACLDWDLGTDWFAKLPIGCDLLAVGNRLGCWGYIYLKRTGHKETKSPLGRYGVRCQVTWNVGPDAELPDTMTAWIVDYYWKKGE